LGVVECFSQRFNRLSHQIALAPFHNFTYILVKKTVLYTVIMFFVPFTALIFVNVRIVMALRESKTLRTMHTYSTNSLVANSSQYNSGGKIRGLGNEERRFLAGVGAGGGHE
jgi:hypothetical protein